MLLEEVADAIAIDPQNKPYFDTNNRMPVQTEVSCYCSSLVSIVYKESNENEYGKRMELHLAHFSVKEYLLSDRIDHQLAYFFEESIAKQSMAELCVSYSLQFGELNSKKLEHRQQVRNALDAFPLAEYSARYWPRYARKAVNSNLLNKLAMDFFLGQADVLISWLRLYDPDVPGAAWQDLNPVRHKKHALSLYHASLEGLVSIVNELLMYDVEVNAQGGRYGNALQAASLGGHDGIVQTLLDHGAEVNGQGGDYGNASQASSSKNDRKRKMRDMNV